MRYICCASVPKRVHAPSEGRVLNRVQEIDIDQSFNHSRTLNTSMLLLQARRYVQLSAILTCSMFVACAGLPSSRTKLVDSRQVEFVSGEGPAPVVVFENGLGARMQGWSKLIPAIEADASYFADNRHGYGNSAPETTPCCGSRVVEELGEALLSEDGNRFNSPDGINARRQIESLQCSRADDQSSEPGAYFLPEIELHSIVSLKGSTAEGKFAAVAVL